MPKINQLYSFPAEEEECIVGQIDEQDCQGRHSEYSFLFPLLMRAWRPQFPGGPVQRQRAVPSIQDNVEKFYLRIPDFIIDDQSFVSIYETSSHLQSSLATSAFTSTDVSAAA